MKWDTKTVLWGTLVALVLIAAATVVPSEFPNFRPPFSRGWIELAAVSAIVMIVAIRAYKALWSRKGFWFLLSALLMFNVLLFWLIIFKLTAGAELPVTSEAFALGAVAEIVVFMLVVRRVYHVWPTGQPLTW